MLLRAGSQPENILSGSGSSSFPAGPTTWMKLAAWPISCPNLGTSSGSTFYPSIKWVASSGTSWGWIISSTKPSPHRVKQWTRQSPAFGRMALKWFKQLRTDSTTGVRYSRLYRRYRNSARRTAGERITLFGQFTSVQLPANRVDPLEKFFVRRRFKKKRGGAPLKSLGTDRWIVLARQYDHFGGRGNAP